MIKQRYFIARILVFIIIIQSMMNSMVYADTTIDFNLKDIVGNIIGDTDNIVSDGAIDVGLSSGALGFNTDEADIAYEDGVPQYVWDIVRGTKAYNDLENPEKYLLTEFMNVREDTMSVCCDNGINIENSIPIALIMQRLDIDYTNAVAMIDNCGSSSTALDYSREFVENRYEIPILNDEIINTKATALAVKGYDVNAIVKAILVSQTLDVEVANVIDYADDVINSVMSNDETELNKAIKNISTYEKTVMDKITTSSAIDVNNIAIDETSISGSAISVASNKNILNLNDEDNKVVKSKKLTKKSVSIANYDIDEVLDVLVTNAYEMGVNESVLGLQNISLYSEETEEDEEDMQNQAPFSLIGRNDFNVSVSSGTVTYDQNLVNLKGAYGLDINVSYNYNSNMPVLIKDNGNNGTEHTMGGFRVNIPRLAKSDVYTKNMQPTPANSIANPNYIFLDDGCGYKAQYDGRLSLNTGSIGTLQGRFYDVGWLKDIDRTGSGGCDKNGKNYESWHMVKYLNGNIDYFDISGKIFKRVNRYGQTNWYVYDDNSDKLTIYGVDGARVEIIFRDDLYSEISTVRAYGYDGNIFKTVNFAYNDRIKSSYPTVYDKITKTESGTNVNGTLTTVFNMSIAEYIYDRTLNPKYKYFNNLTQVDYPTGVSSCIEYDEKLAVANTYPNSFWPTSSYYKPKNDTNEDNRRAVTSYDFTRKTYGSKESNDVESCELIEGGKRTVYTISGSNIGSKKEYISGVVDHYSYTTYKYKEIQKDVHEHIVEENTGRVIEEKQIIRAKKADNTIASYSLTNIYDYNCRGCLIRENREEDAYLVTYEYNNTYGQETLRNVSRQYGENYKVISQYTTAELVKDKDLVSVSVVKINGNQEKMEQRTEYSDYYFGNPQNIVEYVTFEDENANTSAKTKTTNYEYCHGSLVSKKTINGISEEYGYDSMGNVNSYTDGRGKVTNYKYDTFNNLIEVKYPATSGSYRPTQTKSYNYNDNTIEVKDENGTKILYTYNPYGGLVKVENKTNSYITRTLTYDDRLRVATDTNANNAATTTYQYDHKDRVTSMETKDSDGTVLYKETKVYEYVVVPNSTVNANPIILNARPMIWGEKTTSSINNNGTNVVNTSTVDFLNRVIEETSGTKTITYGYNFFNNVVKSVANGDTITTTTYNYLGNPLEEVITNGNDVITTKMEYDNLGRKLKEYTPEGVINNYYTSYVYNDFDKVTKVTTPIDGSNNAVTDYTYDNAGNVKTETVKGGYAGDRVTTYEYDNRNRMVKTTQSDGAKNYITEYEYDNVGNQTALKVGTGSNARVTSYQYDSMNRLKKMIWSDGKYETYSYDNNNNMTSKTDRKGTTISYQYDGLNRMIKQTAGGIVNNYEYTPLGDVKNQSNSNTTMSYEYDNMGQLINELYTIGNVDYKTSYSYYADGMLQSVTKARKNGTTYANRHITEYDYDGFNRMQKTYERKLSGINSGTMSAKTQIAAYSYDDNSNIKTITYNNGATTQYQYNRMNQVTSVSNKKGNNVLSSYAYTYYNDGNQKTKTDHTGLITTYKYDKMNRLTEEKSVSNSYSDTKSYGYDIYGNRNNMNRVLQEGIDYQVDITNYSYDVNNRLVHEESYDSTTMDFKTIKDYVYDTNGNQTYKFTGYIRLQNAPAQNKTVRIMSIEDEINDYYEEYTYNELNQLTGVKKGGVIAEYTYRPDGLRYSKEVNFSKTYFGLQGETVTTEFNSSGNITHNYAMGMGLIKNEAGTYYLNDAHGDIVQLINSSGAVTKDYTYDAFGVENDKSDTDTNPWRYCGEYFDTETGNTYLRARYYNADTGRFMSEDPAFDGVNWYSYCGGNPITFVDPLGLAPTTMEAAEMAEHIYDFDDDESTRTVAGWKLVDVLDGIEGMKMGIYIRADDDFENPTEYTIAFKGTTWYDMEEWKNNVEQVFSANSADMWDAINYSKVFAAANPQEITFVGHSKGGAEAAAAAVATNKNAMIFNPATANLSDYGLSATSYTADMTAYIVRGDIVNNLEGWFSAPIDKAVHLPQQYGGHLFQLGRTTTFQSILNHSMSAVKSALREAGY